jgi:hypothetical protein
MVLVNYFSIVVRVHFAILRSKTMNKGLYILLAGLVIGLSIHNYGINKKLDRIIETLEARQ